MTDPDEETAGLFAERVEQAGTVYQGGLVFIHRDTFLVSVPDGRWFRS